VQAAVNCRLTKVWPSERALFTECLNSPQRAGLVHAFLPSETAKIPEAKAAAPRHFAKIAIIGGGTMGAGITVSALDAGLTVTMIERDADSIARGQANVEKVYNGLIAKGRMTEAKAAIMGATPFDQLRRDCRRGPGDRSRVRGPGSQEGRVQGAGPRLQARRRAGHQHLSTWTSTRLPPPPAARRT
jgi:hypothetical protein